MYVDIYFPNLNKAYVAFLTNTRRHRHRAQEEPNRTLFAHPSFSADYSSERPRSGMGGPRSILLL